MSERMRHTPPKDPNPDDISGDDLAPFLPDVDPEALDEIAERINNTQASAADLAEAELDDPGGGVDDPDVPDD